MTEFVIFDVGGTKYKVSRSTLKLHPNTMLARSASEQWQADPEDEIFIDRDSGRFMYVLDYLRDGCVSLPMTVAKDAVMKDLEYYGVDVQEEAVTFDAQAQSFHTFNILKKNCQQLDNDVALERRNQVRLPCALVARKVFHSYCIRPKHLSVTIREDTEIDIYKSCHKLVCSIPTCNEFLAKTGLRIDEMYHCLFTNNEKGYKMKLSLIGHAIKT